jgi:hypothetical protein
MDHLFAMDIIITADRLAEFAISFGVLLVMLAALVAIGNAGSSKLTKTDSVDSGIMDS